MRKVQKSYQQVGETYFSLDIKVDKRSRLPPNNSVILQWNKQGDKYNFLPRNRSFLGRKSEFPAQGIVVSQAGNASFQSRELRGNCNRLVISLV